MKAMKATYQAPAIQPVGSFRKITDGFGRHKCEYCGRRRRYRDNDNH